MNWESSIVGQLEMPWIDVVSVYVAKNKVEWFVNVRRACKK